MRYKLPVLLATVMSSGLLSGCSFLFGDTFHDRADDYLHVEAVPATQFPDGVEPPIRDAHVIPPLPAGVSAESVQLAQHSDEEEDEGFQAPRPQPFIAAEEEPEHSTSLNDFRTQVLNPRLDSDGAGTRILRLDLGFAASWAAVSEAIAGSTLKLSDLNRSTGTFYLEVKNAEPVEEKGWWASLWADEPEPAKTYLLKMNRARQGVYLSLLTDADNLADEALTERVLSEIEHQLKQ